MLGQVGVGKTSLQTQVVNTESRERTGRKGRKGKSFIYPLHGQNRNPITNSFIVIFGKVKQNHRVKCLCFLKRGGGGADLR